MFGRALDFFLGIKKQSIPEKNYLEMCVEYDAPIPCPFPLCENEGYLEYDREYAVFRCSYCGFEISEEFMRDIDLIRFDRMGRQHVMSKVYK